MYFVLALKIMCFAQFISLLCTISANTDVFNIFLFDRIEFIKIHKRINVCISLCKFATYKQKQIKKNHCFSTHKD